MNIYSALYDIVMDPEYDSYLMARVKIMEIIDKNGVAIPNQIMAGIYDFIHSVILPTLDEAGAMFSTAKEKFI